MSVVNLSSSRILPDNELERVVQLAVTLSGRLNRAPFPEIGLAIAEALEEVASATRTDGCRLIEFTETGSMARTHVPRRNAGEQASEPAALESDLVERLGRGEPVAITRPDQRPFSVLGIPASIGGQVVCALVHRQRQDPAALAAAARRTAATAVRDPRRRRCSAAATSTALRANVHDDRTAERPARGGQRVPEGRDQDLSRLRRHRRRERRPSAGADARWRRSRRPIRTCCCSARPARARSCSRGRCTSAAGAMRVRWCASTARRCRRRWSRASCSATRKAPSPARSARGRDASSSPTAARSSWTKSAISRRRSRSSSSACCRKGNSSGSDRRAPSASTCA